MHQDGIDDPSTGRRTTTVLRRPAKISATSETSVGFIISEVVLSIFLQNSPFKTVKTMQNA